MRWQHYRRTNDGHNRGGDSDDSATLILVSTNAEGDLATGGNFGGSFEPVASVKARRIAFTSAAENLVANDTNHLPDVFVKDTKTGAVVLASAAADGTPGNHISLNPSISDNGRFVGFTSQATNLVADDRNAATDVFLKNIRTGEIALVSADENGTHANGDSGGAAVSANGRFVAFQSSASNLDPRATDTIPDIYVKDMKTEELTLVSVGRDGQEGNSFSIDPSISDDGRFVAFQSSASNLIEGDTPNTLDVFLADLKTGQLTLVSTPPGGTPAGAFSGNPSISGNGRFVAFYSIESLVPHDINQDTFDVYVKDMRTGILTLVSTTPDGVSGNRFSGDPSISPNGRYIAYASEADNLTPGDTNDAFDVFVRDMRTGEVTLVSRAPPGTSGGVNSVNPSVTNDGDVAFASGVEPLVPGDHNGLFDIFLFA